MIDESRQCRRCGVGLNGKPYVEMTVTLREIGRPDAPITVLVWHGRCWAMAALPNLDEATR